jgi:hypothetical protein
MGFDGGRDDRVLQIVEEQCEAFKQFLKPDVTWCKRTRTNVLRGFRGTGAVVKAASLEMMLGQIANFAPIVSRNTIVKNSTSVKSVWDAITLRIKSNGARFLSGLICASRGQAYTDIRRETPAALWPEDYSPGSRGAGGTSCS